MSFDERSLCAPQSPQNFSDPNEVTWNALLTGVCLSRHYLRAPVAGKQRCQLDAERRQWQQSVHHFFLIHWFLCCHLDPGQPVWVFQKSGFNKGELKSHWSRLPFNWFSQSKGPSPTAVVHMLWTPFFVAFQKFQKTFFTFVSCKVFNLSSLFVRWRVILQ